MNSYRLPYALHLLNKDEFSFEESLAIDFMQISKRISDGETLIRFSMVFWPIMLIQAEPDYKLMIDEVAVSNEHFKLINSPRAAQIGHVLRRKGKNYPEKLDTIIKIINYENVEGLDLNGEDDPNIEREYIAEDMPGAFSPEFIIGIGKLIPYQIPFNINSFAVLDSVYNFDQSMQIAQNWFQMLKGVEGNKTRWKSLEEMISKPVNAWYKELIVKLKDQNEIYDKAIRNASNIDEIKIRTQLNKQKDVMDSWVLQEQKAMAERIGKMFKGIDLVFEDLRNHNKFFLNTDQIRTKPIGEVVMNAYKNIAHIRTGLEDSNNKIYQISEKLNKIRKELENTSLSADEKIQLFNLELQNKKAEQEEEIRKLQQEKDRKIRNLNEYKDQISTKLSHILELIQKKLENCQRDLRLLRSHQITDQVTKITKPTQRLFIPIGIGIIEDQDFEERIEMIFPSTYDSKMERLPFMKNHIEYEKFISEILDDDMKLRSNFEFTVENAPNYAKQLKIGFDSLVQKNYIDLAQKEKYLSIFGNKSSF